MNLQTERLIIRRFTEQDAEDLYAYLSRPEVVRYEPYEPFTREEALQAARERAEDPSFYAVALKSGRVIGNLYFAQGEFDTWELGYVFNDAYWGAGYASESAGALLSYAFQTLGVRRVIAMCNPENAHSWRLLERLGFRREGHLRQNIWFFRDDDGEPIWQDTYEYGLLREEWQA
ncbi:MAG: GNAT family N-acetyltransferase [Hominenteromicrobium sp.]